MVILLGALLFFFVLYWDVNSDYKKWKMDVPVNHKDEALIRAALLLPSVFCLSFPDFTIWNVLTTILLEMAVWWELFDGWYNKKRGFSWRFTGSDDADDSKTDELLQKLTYSQQALLKWGLIGISLFLYILAK